jgi:uncharacterized caspase-like protein
MEQSLDPFGLATGSEQPSAGDTRIVREKWALVIGVSRFQDRRIPKLRYTGKDAQDFAAVLRDSAYGRFQPDHVHLVLDEEATTKKIKAELNWLARSAAPEDLVVIYLASHGSPRELDTAGLNYIVTNDTEVKPEDNLFATALPMVELSDVVRSRIRARRTAIFLDTCHSGAALGASSASPEALDRIRQGAGRVIIASSQVNERSWESDTLQHGYFTYFLIQALKQDKGLAPIDKIYQYVKEQVSKRVAADAKQRQTPVLSRSDRGAEIVVGVKPATAIAGGASASAER